jgi:DNA-binding SARP family transcriptional activator
MITLRLLGSIDLRHEHGEPVDAVLRRPKLLALLSYLAIARPRGFHRKDKLVARFWPESDQERARHALRQVLYVLRRELGEESLLSRGDEELSLNEDVVSSDVAVLRQALEGGREADAVESYRGDLLDGFHLGDVPEFERWVEGERTRLRERITKAVEALADREEVAENYRGAVRWVRQLVELSPDDEGAVRRLIMLLDRIGDRSGALRTYEEFAKRLAEEFDVDPSAETQALVNAIRHARGGKPPRAFEARPTFHPFSAGLSGGLVAAIGCGRAGPASGSWCLADLRNVEWWFEYDVTRCRVAARESHRG